MFRIKMLFAGVLLFMLLAGDQNLRGQDATGTVLLFNYVTNQSNFDSTVVISNTPMDPQGVTSRSGACMLNYYGDTNGQPTTTVQQSAAILPGSQLVFSLSGGSSNGVAATPGFQGYIIANCDFPSGQGTAKITDTTGTQFLSVAPALVLGNSVIPLTRLFPPATNSTALLFNFVTNKTNFDTRLVISNSTLDPFGTTAVSGACTIYYYGTASGSTPAKQTSASIDGGTGLYFSLSAGGGGITPTPGFQGSIIANCNFPFAQGTALITDPAASKYLSVVPATVLDRAIPVANPGPSRNVAVGSTVTLDGTGSTDADNDPLTYSWSLISIPGGSTTVLSGSNTATPVFVPDLVGTYVAQLVVNDGFSNSAPVAISITATAVATASIAFTPANVSIPGTVTQNLTLSLSSPAPATGQIINLYSSVPAIATVPASVNFLPGALTATVPVTTFAPGKAVIHASALPNIAETTATLTVLQNSSTVISFAPQSITINGPSTVQYATLSIAGNTPPTGLLVNLTSDNPGVATVPSSIVFAPNMRSVTVPVTGVVPGTAIIHASALPTVADTVLNVTVTPKRATTISFNPSTATITALTGQSLTLTLSIPAPANGLTFSLSSSNPAVATVPATVTCTANTTTVNIPITAIGAGKAVIHAGAPPEIADTTANITVLPFVGGPPAFIVNDASVGKNLEGVFTFNLTQPAPAGGLDITITSGDATKLLVAGHQNVLGTNSLTLTLAQGLTQVSGIYLQALDSSGSIPVTVSAANYASGTATITLTQSGFVIAGPGGASIFSANQGLSSALTVSAARLDSSLNAAEMQQIRGGYTTTVTVTSSAPDVGAIATSPLAFNGGDGSMTTQFTAGNVGSTTVTVGVPTDFTMPSTGGSVTVNVSPSGLVVGALTVAQGLESGTQIFLKGTVPTGGVQISLSSNNPGSILFSNTPTGAGSASITINVSAGRTSSPSFWVYGLASSGTPTYTASAPGFGSSTGTVTLRPATVIISSAASFTITTGAPNSTISVATALADPSGTFTVQAVAGGGSVSVPVISSNPSAGTITASPVTIPGGSSNGNTEFDPAAAGLTTISLGVPTGFVAAASNNTVAVRVIVAGIGISEDAVGQNLQSLGTLLIGQPAPAGGVVVTLTSNNPSQLVLSKSGTTSGSASIKITIPAGSYNASYFIQGLGSSGTVSYTATAPGFNSRTAQMTLVPSAVIIQGLYGPNPPIPFYTVPVGSSVPVTVSTARLDPATGNYDSIQALAGGQSLSVSLTNSNPAAGTVTSPLLIPGGNDSANTQFNAVKAGNVLITVVKPPTVTRAAANNTQEAIKVQ